MNDIYKQFGEISKYFENLSKALIYKKLVKILQETKEEESDDAITYDILIDAFNDAIKYRTKRELEGKTEGDWIPISERLPEDGTWNIWQGKTGAIGVERYKEDAYKHFCPSGRFFQFEDAIAWMPLPERYKGDDKT